MRIEHVVEGLGKALEKHLVCIAKCVSHPTFKGIKVYTVEIYHKEGTSAGVLVYKYENGATIDESVKEIFIDRCNVDIVAELFKNGLQNIK